MTRFRVVDVFAGAGGLSLGFELSAHFEVVGAVEIDPHAQRTFTRNHKAPILASDIRSIDVRIADSIGPIDVLLGGPPCQAFSTIGKRDPSDPRVSLFQEYIRTLILLQPRAFVFENVKGMLSALGGKLFPEVLEALRNCGYQVTYKVLNAAHYGVPQTRERVIIVGSRFEGFQFPEKVGEKVTLRDAIGNFPSPTSDGAVPYHEKGELEFHRFVQSSSGILTGHTALNHSESLVESIRSIPEGGRLAEIEQGGNRKMFRNSYARLWWDAPSPTITRKFGSPSSARCIHPSEPRGLTIREAARVQSFPDWFEFVGGIGSQRLQIGNAVPPLLAKKLGEALYAHLFMNLSSSEGKIAA